MISYEKNNWFYFLYEILKESIFFKKISLRKYKERLLPMNIHTIKFRTPDLQILYTPML